VLAHDTMMGCSPNTCFLYVPVAPWLVRVGLSTSEASTSSTIQSVQVCSATRTQGNPSGRAASRAHIARRWVASRGRSAPKAAVANCAIAAWPPTTSGCTSAWRPQPTPPAQPRPAPPTRRLGAGFTPAAAMDQPDKRRGRRARRPATRCDILPHDGLLEAFPSQCPRPPQKRHCWAVLVPSCARADDLTIDLIVDLVGVHVEAGPCGEALIVDHRRPGS
jgi:hypothetical protein